jgi:hypothetical protein
VIKFTKNSGDTVRVVGRKIAEVIRISLTAVKMTENRCWLGIRLFLNIRHNIHNMMMDLTKFLVPQRK